MWLREAGPLCGSRLEVREPVHSGRQAVRAGPLRFGRAWDYEGRCSAPGTSHNLWFAQDDVVRTDVRLGTAAEVVELFRLTLTDPTWGMRMASPSRGGHFLKVTVGEIRAELAGHDLMCWCLLTDVRGDPVPCHADVLLELAAANDPVGIAAAPTSS